MRLKPFRLVLALAALVLAWPAPSPGAEPPSIAQATPHVRLAMVAGGTTLAIFVIADKLGLYRKHGIEVETLSIDTSPAGLAAVVAGSVQFTFTGANITDAVVAGLPLTTILSVGNVPLGEVCALKSIATPADLAGKTIVTLNRGSAPDVSMRIWLQRNGLDESRLTIRNVDLGFPAVLAAATSGVAQAFVINPPRCAQAAQNGFAVLADLGTMGVEFFNGGVATSRAFIASNRDTVKRFLAALVEARRIFQDDRETALATIRDLEKTNDPVVVESVWAFFKSHLAHPPLVSEKALLEAIKASGNARTREAGPALVGTMYDNGPLEEVLRP